MQFKICPYMLHSPSYTPDKNAIAYQGLLQGALMHLRHLRWISSYSYLERNPVKVSLRNHLRPSVMRLDAFGACSGFRQDVMASSKQVLVLAKSNQASQKFSTRGRQQGHKQPQKQTVSTATNFSTLCLKENRESVEADTDVGIQLAPKPQRKIAERVEQIDSALPLKEKFDIVQDVKVPASVSKGPVDGSRPSPTKESISSLVKAILDLPVPPNTHRPPRLRIDFSKNDRKQGSFTGMSQQRSRYPLQQKPPFFNAGLDAFRELDKALFDVPAPSSKTDPLPKLELGFNKNDRKQGSFGGMPQQQSSRFPVKEEPPLVKELLDLRARPSSNSKLDDRNQGSFGGILQQRDGSAIQKEPSMFNAREPIFDVPPPSTSNISPPPKLRQKWGRFAIQEEPPVFNAENPRVDALGRTLCRILRHQAVKLRLNIRSDGYCRVDELLNLGIRTHAGIPLRAHTEEEVLKVAKEDPKQRYSIMVEDGQLYIRANQGHSMKVVLSDKLLTEVTSADQVPVCVHGTFKMFLSSIMRTGLSRMGRNHVHFATGLPNDEGVISGMRETCEVLIYLDVKKALEDGMKLYISDNKVLLTEGFGGVVPCEYFEKVVEWPSFAVLA